MYLTPLIVQGNEGGGGHLTQCQVCDASIDIGGK